MPSILRDLPAVAWLAGKNFTFQGKEYKVGDEVPEVNEFPRLEVYVRTRTVIPIVESMDDIPFQFRHTVMTRERAVKKLKTGNAGGGEADTVLAERTLRVVEEPAEQPSESQVEETELPQAFTAQENEFNPADHSVDQVIDYVENNPEEAITVYEAEEQGRKRKTLLAQLDEFINNEGEVNV